MEFGNINYLAVLVATIAAFALGALWYSKPLFAKAWMKEVGLTEEDAAKSGVAKTMAFSFLLFLIMCFGLAYLIQGHGNDEIGWLSGLFHGLLMGVVFVGCSMGINYLYQMKSFKLWLIDTLYQVIALGVMGLILGAWH